MRIVLLGPPGSGKGTQGKRIAKHLNIPHISTGDIMRDLAEQNSELGRTIKALIDDGELVSDEVLFQALDERLKKEDATTGYVLDGTPRNINQSKELEKRHRTNRVLYYEVSDEEVVKRIGARWYCPKDHTIYNMLVQPPKKEGTCDVCGGELVQREDDKAEHVQQRLNIYHGRTEPVIAFYEEKGILVRVNGEQPIEDVWKNTLSILERK